MVNLEYYRGLMDLQLDCLRKSNEAGRKGNLDVSRAYWDVYSQLMKLDFKRWDEIYEGLEKK